MADEDVEHALAAAMAAVKEDYEEAAMQIRAISDPQRAFERATELVSMLREITGHAADERAFAAERIKERERLSLAQLGERIGMSKQRAGKLLERAEKARQQPIRRGVGP